ncbi:MAG: methyl-accepting chemotaxis protein [Treponema sp.]|nr:methyl-accepting chemotaxis protein [Treponema sp.]
MTLYFNFILFFIPATFATTFLIRWYALAFLYRDLGRYWKGFGSTLAILMILLIAVLILMYFFFLPFDKAIKKEQTTGIKPNAEEKQKCLGAYHKVGIAIWTVDIIGFFIGQLAVMIIGIKAGRAENYLPRLIMVMAQCLCCAVFSAVIEMQVANEIFAKGRKYLDIHSVKDFENQKSIKFSTSSIILVLTCFFFIIVNMMTVPFNLIARPTLNNEVAIRIYLKESIFSGLICFLMPGAVCSYIFGSFSKRIAMNLNRVFDIAQEGNLTSRLSLSILDDYGALSGAINELIEKLSQMIGTLKNDTSVVDTQSETLAQVTESATVAIEQMRSSFKKIEEGNKKQNDLVFEAEKDVISLTEDVERVKEQVTAQTASVEMASAAINEMSANIASVAEMTRKADQVSSALSQSSVEGRESIKGAVAAISELQKVSSEVEEIVKVIQAISSQTNLLSMNAAIEAAHAGEFGAGFAVVADEVRTLAQSSSESAKDIRDKIKDMVDKINAGVDSITVAGKSFKDIEENVQATSELVRTIASSMEEQRQSTEDTLRTTTEMVTAIQSVKALTEHESQRAENVRSAMQNVVASSQDAMSLVNDGVQASELLNTAINQVSQSVRNNQNAVHSMTKTVESYKV